MRHPPPHHRECWEWVGGCGVYGCKKTPRRKVKIANAASLALPGKLGLPHKRTGSYAGVWWVPPEETALTIALEVVALFLALVLNWIAAAIVCFWAMCAVLVWIALMSVRHYVDLETMTITTTRTLLGFDVREWPVAKLREVSHLEIRGIPGTWHPAPTRLERKNPDWVPYYSAYEILAVYRKAKTADKLKPPVRRPLALSPAMTYEGESLRQMADVFRRMQSASAFPVRIPRAVRQLPPPATQL